MKYQSDATSKEAWWVSLQSLLQLAWPILGAQVAQTGMSVVDTLMAGRLSALDLAAVSVGSSLWMPLFLFVIGTLLATTALVAQAQGARQYGLIAASVQQALWVAILLTLVGVWVLTHSEALFIAMQVETEIRHLSLAYLEALAWGLPAVAGFQILRSYCEALGHTRPMLLIALCGLLLNIPANYALIYGVWGFPQLGAVGCGYATALSFWVMLLLALAYTGRSQSFAMIPLYRKFTGWVPAIFKEILSVGLPIGVAIFAEVSLFAVIALFIARFGETVLAAHQIAINLTSLLFMLPLSFGMALTIRVGNAVGAQAHPYAACIATRGIWTALVIACIMALSMLIAATHLVSLYTENTQVIQLAATLVSIAAAYQISDALQVTCAGALRGYKDTRVIMWVTLFAYWVVGLGGGYALGLAGLDVFGIQIAPLGVYGFWYGLIAGLTCAAALLVWRLRYRMRQPA